MTIDELHSNLQFIRDVMRREMREGQDYGKIPGAGEKPCLLQPGAQKLLMTFNLTEAVKKEVLREYPGWHREYEFTVTVRAPNGKEWDGVGTCSTLESKYRYRKVERQCPTCGKQAIIAGKAEYGGGWLCWKKKGGCGATFKIDDPAIAGQQGGKIENPDVADTWNTVRKMSFKRALVAAAINATNTSELWTQDLEDSAPSEPISEPDAPPPPTRAPVKVAPKPATASPTLMADEKFRAKMITNLHAGPGEPARDLVTQYFRKIAQLLPNEEVEDLPLRFVPLTKGDMNALAARLAEFERGDEAKAAFDPHTEPPPAANKPPKASKDDEAWREVIVPIPRKGQKRDEYMKHPDTIGTLFDARHGEDDESAAARQRLFGFVHNYEPKGWQKSDGTQMSPSESDLKFREALDAFADWFERNHPNEKL